MTSLLDLYKEDLAEYNQSFKIKNGRVCGPIPGGDASGDSTRFSLNPDKNVWYDFAENQGGGVLQYLLKIRGWTYSYSAKYLGIEVLEPTVEETVLEEYCKWANAFIAENGAAAKDYLESRGFDELDIADFNLGYSGNKQEAVKAIAELNKKYPTEILQSAGLVSRDGNPTFVNRLIVPFTNNYGYVTYIKGRHIPSLSPSTDIKYQGLLGYTPKVYGFPRTKTVLVTEGLLDALTLEKYGYNAVALPSATFNDVEVIQLLQTIKKDSASVFFLPDFDDAGYKCLEKFTVMAEKLGVPVSVKDYRIEGSSVHDVNEFFNYFPSKIEALEAFKNMDSCPESLSLLFQGKNFPPRDIKDIEACVSRIAYYDSPLVRDVLKNDLSETFGISKNAVSAVLKNTKRQPIDILPKVNRVEYPAERLSEVLKQPDILEYLVNLTENYGHIGERLLKKALVLSCVNRISNDPIHIIVKGDSSSGKSSTVESVLSLFNNEDIVSLTSMSKQVLNYMGEMDGGVKHKILYLGEAGGTTDQEVQTALRQLMSEGKIVRYIAQKDEATEKIVVGVKLTEGPATVIITTTKYLVDDETETRMMALNTDTSLAQTQKIHRAQYKMAEGFSKSQETSPLDLVRQALATLKPLKVIIPYAGFLEFPAKLSRSRRDNSRMLQLIRASALLHQANRPMAVHQETETTYIKATLEDYAIAHELLQLVPSCTDNISARLIDDHKTLLQHFGCRTPISMVNVKSVKNTNLDKAKELLMELESAGLVDQYDGGARQRLYIIKDIKKYASLYGVISPDKLKSKVVSVCGEDKAADLLGISDFDKTYNKIEEFVESEEESTETESSKPFLQVNESQTVTEVNEEDII